MDEGLDILTGLWRGQPFNHQGKHYTVKEASFSPPPPPIQQPRIPIWMVGGWPSMKSMRRVLRYDGLLPNVIKPNTATDGPTIDELGEMRAFIEANRTETTPFDIVMEGQTPGNDAKAAAALVRP